MFIDGPVKFLNIFFGTQQNQPSQYIKNFRYINFSYKSTPFHLFSIKKIKILLVYKKIKNKVTGYKKKVKILSKKKYNLINLCFVLAYGVKKKKKILYKYVE